jgi:hypothetical protein
MGFFKALLIAKKLNADPEQQALAQMFIDAAEGKVRPRDVHSHLVKTGRPASDVRARINHALSMVKIFRPDLYPAASAVGKDIYVNF